MRIRFLVFIFISTILALLFVHNQINIYLLSYKLEKNNILYEELLDEKGILSYDINRLSSVNNLFSKLKDSKDEFIIPRRIVMIKREEGLPKENFFVRLFKYISLAEAKESR